MAKKRELVNRLHWGWAENYTPGCISDADVKTAYRLHNETHRPNTCIKNCKGNPNCLSGFGEHNWNQAIDKEAELKTYNSSNQRTPGTYVGLKNLGNICYINSLLQLWFHNIPFREAVYGWNASEDQDKIAKHLETFNRDIDLNNYQPLSSVAHLQLLFGEMQFGLTKYCDPEAFCRSLAINVESEEDAPEFNKVYMQTLENLFKTSSNPKTNQIIQTLFRGQYSYITRCCSCNYESTQPSFFYELDLNVKNCHTILKSLQDFFSETKLSKENQYYCSKCNKKQDATTGIRLQQLPPVLQLQLLRYEIDAAAAQKTRKIHSSIKFPDNLDMSPYLDCPQNTHIYKLNAVLMHDGSTADSGHYYVHINTAEGWHIFDDINVKKQEYLNFTNEEVVSNADKKSRIPKSRGFHSSTSAYMLVYIRVDEKESTCSVSQSANVKVTSKSGKSVDNENQNTKISKSSEANQVSEIKVGVKVNELQNMRKLPFQENKVILKKLPEIPAKSGYGRFVNVKKKPYNIKLLECKIEIVDCKNVVKFYSRKRNESSNGDDDNPNDLEFLDTPEGSLNLRSKLDATHWDMLSAYSKSALLKSSKEFKKKLVSKETEINQKIEVQNLIKTISETLTPEPKSEDYEFINFECLKSITKLPSSPVDNSTLLCKHGKLDVSLEKQFKVISKKAADFLYGHCSGGPRLTSESLCRICMENQAKKFKLKMEVTKDSKLMNQLSKQLIELHHPAYWVGKKSLKSWTNYVLHGNDDQVEDNDESESSNTVKEDNKTEVKLKRENAKKRLIDQPKPETCGEITSGGISSFNDDIKCIHGGLVVDKNKRKLVSEATWNVFVKYFPNCKVFDRNHPPCPDCQTNEPYADANTQDDVGFMLPETGFKAQGKVASSITKSSAEIDSSFAKSEASLDVSPRKRIQESIEEDEDKDNISTAATYKSDGYKLGNISNNSDGTDNSSNIRDRTLKVVLEKSESLDLMARSASAEKAGSYNCTPVASENTGRLKREAAKRCLEQKIWLHVLGTSKDDRNKKKKK